MKYICRLTKKNVRVATEGTNAGIESRRETIQENDMLDGIKFPFPGG